MVRKKNIMNTIALPFVGLAVVSLAWSLVCNGWAAWNAGEPPGTHDPLRSLYRGMMASIALALVAGGIVERIRFSFFLVFALCWIAGIYVPLPHPFWGGCSASPGTPVFAAGAVFPLIPGARPLVRAI